MLIRYRPATEDDAEECVRLRGLTRENAVSAQRLREVGITVESWATDIRTGALPGVVCVADEQMVGYCFGAAATGEIVVLVVMPAFEGQGIGRHLLTHVVQHLRGLGHSRLFLGCSADPWRSLLRLLPPAGLAQHRRSGSPRRRGARAVQLSSCFRQQAYTGRPSAPGTSMTHDPFAEMKRHQREMWASFGPTALFTTPVAGHTVRFAGIVGGESVLDVGTGTGVLAISAARRGAKVTGLDLTPELLEQARENATIAGLPDIAWREGDVEQLPYADASFDVVVSQFGHMFAPRPDVAVSEMRRVLKPGGRIAFATWPPEHMVGRLFAFIGRYAPPPPAGAAPPPLWGNPMIIAERLGDRFAPPFFERGVMKFAALSIPHYRLFMERSVGPMQKLVESLAGDPQTLARFHAEFEALTAPYHFDNVVHQDYLLTRAQAV